MFSRILTPIMRLGLRTAGRPNPEGRLGGPDLRTLFVTSGRWSIADKDAADHPLDGGIIALEAPVPGLPCSRWAG